MASSLLPTIRSSGIFTSLRTALFSPAVIVPVSFSLNIPILLPGIFESILRAVPKKKPTHSKRRMRQLAGKALKDVENLNNCPGCGRVKRAHTLCEHCVSTIQGLWRKEGRTEQVEDSA